MTEVSPSEIETRAQNLATFYLTRRDDLAVIQQDKEYRLDFLLKIIKDSESTEKLFGIEVKGVRPPEDQSKPSELKTFRIKDSQLNLLKNLPFPICLFIFTIENDKGYYRWINEPITEPGRFRRLMPSKKDELTTLTNREVDKIVARVSKWYDTPEAELFNLDQFNTRTTSNTLGEVVLGYISVADMKEIEDLLWSVRDDREFTVKALHHQLQTPKIELTDFENLTDDELRHLARAYAQNELKQPLDQVPDVEVFNRFREATKTKFQKDRDEFQATISKIGSGLSDHLIKLANKPIEDAIKRMTDLQLKSIKEAVSKIYIPTPKIADMIGTARMNELLSVPSYVKDALSNVSGMKQLAEQQSMFSKKLIEDIQKSLVLPPDFTSGFLMPQIQAMQSWANVNTEAFSAIGNFWKNFEITYSITEEEAIKVLKRYNWFVSPSLPSSFVYEAVRIGRKRDNQRKAINKLFWDYFAENGFENLSKIVEGWSSNPIFTKQRMKILRDCVSVLRNAKLRINTSNVVLPTLIAQIDGVLTGYRKKKGFTFTSKKAKKQLEQLKAWVETEAVNQDVMSEPMLELTNYIFFEVLFQSAYHGQPLENPYTFSRHKIMHGEFLTYGRRDNVIRAFLILDFLAALK
jgi:hypothetical protein